VPDVARLRTLLNEELQALSAEATTEAGSGPVAPEGVVSSDPVSVEHGRRE
jgi:hypothetical protein